MESIVTLYHREYKRNMLVSLDRVKMRQIFRLTSELWIRSFLLSTNVVEDAKLLMEPVQSMYAISGEHLFSVQLENNELKQSRTVSRWLMMPVSNREGKILGLYISENCDDEVTSLHVVRFIRDDQTGEMLYITEIPQSNTIEVMHTHMSSRSSTVASYLRFDSKTLRRLFEHPEMEASLLESLLTCCVVSDHKPCHVCIGKTCQCPLMLRPATHSLDFRFFRQNSQYLFGAFRGEMAISTYRKGAEQSCQFYPVHNVTTHESAAFTAELLRNAVQSRLRLLNVSLSSLNMPQISTAQIFPSNSLTKTSAAPSIGGLSQLNTNRMPHHGWPPPDAPSSTDSAIDAASELANTIDWLVDGNALETSQHNNNRVSTASTANVSAPKPIVATLLPRADSTTPEIMGPIDKATIRKIRKREAAQRSNTRRHLRRIQLKQELCDIHRKVSTLSKRKEMLERERSQLITQLDATMFYGSTCNGSASLDGLFGS